MLSFRAAICRKQRAVSTFCLAFTLVSLIAVPAEARHWRSHHRHAHFARLRHHEELIRDNHASARAANIAAIVIDGNSGKTLYARNANELRYPASITKVMTLYLLFEQLERGHLRLDSSIRVSTHAAAQKPTKLGLHPGDTISVEDAIRAVVTRSANDIAVAIAETIANDEENFARLMTSKAHALGMMSTHFANASGLPDSEQVTTARDLAILGRAIKERFPRYYHYFATRAFYYRGAAIVNHNHLLDRVEGMDGIKTGYTNASGFNLLASVKRDGHYIVAVVLGGPSARARDRLMADLIEDQIENGATVRTASAITETSVAGEVEPAAKNREASVPRAEPGTKIGLRVPMPSAPTPDPSLGSIETASLNANAPAERPRPAFVSGAPRPLPAGFRTSHEPSNWKQASLDGSTTRARAEYGRELATTTPSAIRPIANPAHPGKNSEATDEVSQNGIVKVAGGLRPAAARSGWMIQIGATTDEGKASELIARAKSEGPKVLLRAQPFTEKIQKGSETLYRARFAGLGEASAELACRALKRSGFSCFATKN